MFDKKVKLLLASASPRRRQLLSELGFPVEILPARSIDESYPASLLPEEVPVYLSGKKSVAYAGALSSANEILVTADTVVILDGNVIGKPRSLEEAVGMIANLSGRTHKVVSGVTLADNSGRCMSFGTETFVTFSKLTPEEIEWYVANYRPTDKAGAYGIQEWIGYVGVEGIRGDYYNVMGLPLHDLYLNLKKILNSK